MTQIKIVSDGTPVGTSVQTMDGQVLEGVKAISWFCSANFASSHIIEARITFENVPVELAGEMFKIEETIGVQP